MDGLIVKDTDLNGINIFERIYGVWVAMPDLVVCSEQTPPPVEFAHPLENVPKRSTSYFEPNTLSRKR